MSSKRKKKVGIFSFTCDEGCSIFLTEIFNKKLLAWLERAEIDYFLSIKSHKQILPLDIALVEGVISTREDKKLIKEIREKSRVLIAMGSCAISALPSGQRNNFSPEQNEAIEGVLRKFKFLKKALAVKEVVKVEDEVPGCPIIEKRFIEVFEKYLF